MTAPFALPLVADGTYLDQAKGEYGRRTVADLSRPPYLASDLQLGKQRAAYIARAVNLHERLVEALTKAETFITDCEWSIADPDWDIRADGIVLELRELLREAEAE